MAERLTVLIPCKNEERNIRPCIESAKGIADELLVADSGSADRTMEIAKELQELGDPAGRARLGPDRGLRRARHSQARA